MQKLSVCSDLSFVVCGVARSGTTALAHALNLIPEVYCAHETSIALSNPNDFIGDMVPEIRRRLSGAPPRSNRGRSLIELEEKVEAGSLQYLGDKLPDYVLLLDEVDVHAPKVGKIVIYRSPYGFMPSWDVRAENPDSGWEAGRIGLFGLLDMLIAFDNVGQHPGTLVSYSALLFEQPDLFTELAKRLFGLKLSSRARGRFGREFFNRPLRPSTASDQNRYGELLDEINITSIDEWVRKRALLSTTDADELLRTYARSTLARLLGPVERLMAKLSETTRAEVRSYAPVWINRRRATLAARGACLGSFDVIGSAIMKI